MVSPASIDIVLKRILSRLARDYAPLRVILFGSYATGQPHVDSDIDLLVIKETSEPMLRRMGQVRELLADVQGTTPLDVLVLTPREVGHSLRSGDEFIRSILEKGEVVLGSGKLRLTTRLGGPTIPRPCHSPLNIPRRCC